MKQETMMELFDQEVAERLATRRDALRSAGRASLMLALSSVPVALAMTAKRTFAQGLPQNVVDILNYALTLEYLENEYYKAGLAATGLIPSDQRIVFQTIQAHEQAHVDFLIGALGSAAVDQPEFDFTAGGAFGDVFSNYGTFLALAQGFEDTGVRAYKGQAPNLVGGGDLLEAALTIHSVEARHAAMVRRMRGQKGWIVENQVDVAALRPVYAGEQQTVQLGVNVSVVASVSLGTVSEAFDEPLPMSAVLEIAGLFIAG